MVDAIPYYTLMESSKEIFEKEAYTPLTSLIKDARTSEYSPMSFVGPPETFARI
jgi:hypothetical protein